MISNWVEAKISREVGAEVYYATPNEPVVTIERAVDQTRYGGRSHD